MERRNVIGGPGASPQPPPLWLRAAVRGVLENSTGYRALDAERRRALANAMVKVSALAADWIAEDLEAQAAIDDSPGMHRGDDHPPPLAQAQEAPEFGAATDRLATTTRNVLGAVSFPRFVTDLVNGVFRAMLDSNSQQMQMYVDLLNNVSTSVEGFERTQFSAGQVRRWLVDRFPEHLEYEPADVESGEPVDPEESAEERLRLRAGAGMPTEEAIRATLGLESGQPIEAGNPEQLVPLARRQIARQRQQMLATMVMLGMQRIVIDSGRINASMRFHIDTRSAAAEDRGSQFGMQNRVRAAGSFGYGPWGASAEVENNISYVSTQRTQRTEEINTDLELNSSVELNFRTDYLPLNQMAAQAQADRIRNASLNPSAETSDPAGARTTRLQAQFAAERERSTGIGTAVDTASRLPQLGSGEPLRPPRTGDPSATGSTTSTTRG